MKKKKSWGGKRKGAGRPIADTVELFVTVRTATAAKLARKGNEMGLCKSRGGGRPFIGAVVDHLAESLETQEPEYLRIARELRA